MEATVLYEYVAQEPGELTIKQGDTIKDVSTSNIEGWLFGTLDDGQSGIFPGNFVELLLEQPDRDDPSSRFSEEYNGMGSMEVEVEEEWWKGKMTGEVEVFSSKMKIPTNQAMQKNVTHRSSSNSQPKMLINNSSSYPAHSVCKPVSTVKLMSPEDISRSKMSPTNTPSYPAHSSKREAPVKSNGSGDTIPVPHTTSQEIAAERSRKAQHVSKMDPTRIQSLQEKLRHVFPEAPQNIVPSVTGNKSLPRHMEMDGGNNPGTPNDVFDLVSNFQMKKGGSVKMAATPSTNGQSIPKIEIKKQTNGHLNSSPSGKAGMKELVENMMTIQGQGGPTANYSSPQITPSKENPGNISSSISPHPPPPPPLPSNGKMTPRKGAAPPPPGPPPPPPPPDPSQPPPPPRMPAQTTSPAGDDQGRNAVMESIRTFNKAKLKGVATADKNRPANANIFESAMKKIKEANIGRDDSLEEPDDNDNETWD